MRKSLLVFLIILLVAPILGGCAPYWYGSGYYGYGDYYSSGNYGYGGYYGPYYAYPGYRTYYSPYYGYGYRGYYGPYRGYHGYRGYR